MRLPQNVNKMSSKPHVKMPARALARSGTHGVKDLLLTGVTAREARLLKL